MIGVFVTFRCGDNFNEQVLRKVAEAARTKFEGMPGLRSKAFTITPAKREATNFYIWDSEDAVMERVTALYGLRPNVDVVQIATLVDNSHVRRDGD